MDEKKINNLISAIIRQRDTQANLVAQLEVEIQSLREELALLKEKVVD